MPQSVTCSCGKRITVGPQSNADAVQCPACGEAVALHGAAQPATALTFGVRKQATKGEPNTAASRSTPEPGETAAQDAVEFFCPGCGRQFRQPAQAAGKQTQCPQCETRFTIPPQPVRRGNGSGAHPPAAGGQVTEEDEARSSDTSQSEKPSEEAVAAAVVAYNAGKTPAAAGRSGRAKWILPIGIILLLLGGLLSVLGSYLMVKGYLQAYAPASILSGEAGAGGDLMKPVADYSKLLQDLRQEPGARGRRGRQPPDNDPDLASRERQRPENPGKSLQQQMQQREAERKAGESLLLWGVVTRGTGKLLTFIGGIFLLAALIGRFLRPQPATASSEDKRETTSTTA